MDLTDQYDRISESGGASNTTPTLTTTQPWLEGHIMAERQPNSAHPTFQPREAKQNVATAYLLWMISAKVFVKPSGCWTWGGRRSEDGYGILDVGRGNLYRVHRLVYEHCVGDIPDGLLVLHDCDNPSCCNPAHLYVGDHQDNAIDCVHRGRNPSAILTEDTVRLIRALASGPARQSTRRLAERFGVTVGTIQDVLSRRKWGHVE